jgi:hypothetical protein
MRSASCSTTKEVTMKTSLPFKSISLIALLGAALCAPVLAQPGPGMGAGPGMQNGGPGPGGPGMRGMRAYKGNAPGWNLMTQEERTAYQIKMRAVKTYDECTQLQTEQHKTMEARAKEKGVTLPAPRQNRCDRMKARGLIK